MADDAPVQVAAYVDQASAEMLAGMLRQEGLPAEVRVKSSLPGIVDEASVLVPPSLAHRARWLISEARVTDEELHYAATGELPGDDA